MKILKIFLLIVLSAFLSAEDASENSELRDLYKESTSEVKPVEKTSSLAELGKILEGKDVTAEGSLEKKVDFDEILKYLSSENQREKISAIKMLGLSKQKKYTKEIGKFLKDKNPLVVEAAIEAYGFAKDDAYVPMLRPILKIPNRAMRDLVLKALFNIKGKKAEDMIIELLEDGDSSMRAKAAETLANMKSKGAAIRLTRSMCCDPSGSVQKSAAKALAEIQNPISIKDLKDGLEASDKTIAFYCAVGLARMQDKSGMKLLLGTLNNELGIRTLALEALSNLSDREMIEPLNLMSLNDKSPYLAKKAGALLKKLEEKYKK